MPICGVRLPAPSSSGDRRQAVQRAAHVVRSIAGSVETPEAAGAERRTPGVDEKPMEVMKTMENSVRNRGKMDVCYCMLVILWMCQWLCLFVFSPMNYILYIPNLSLYLYLYLSLSLYIYMCAYIHIHIHIHYIALHCIALHYTTLHYIHMYIYIYTHAL